MSAVVALKNLRKSFRGHLGIGSTVAVDGLDLTVQPGEIFGLLGPNGAGKTTTLKLMLGLLEPDSGEALLFGRPPRDVAARARLGFLPENPYFYDYLTPVEFLDLYARLHGVPAAERRDRIHAAIRRVGLAGREKTALRKFSKGMIQRLGLAQAIQHDPELVILDEPMSGLDPVGRREVRDLILGLRAAGRTVFFSSHILQDAEMVCDRVAIMFRGRLREIGRLDDLVSRDARWIEVAVRGTVPADAPGERTAAPDGTTLVKVDGAPALAKLLGKVTDAGGEVLSVWPRRDTLEDLFLREINKAQAEEKAS
jgi:ABC-2 type transport system ATP-binding protein